MFKDCGVSTLNRGNTIPAHQVAPREIMVIYRQTFRGHKNNMMMPGRSYLAYDERVVASVLSLSLFIRIYKPYE